MRILHLCLSSFFIDNYSYQENLLPKYHVKQGHEVAVIASLFTFDEKGKGTLLNEPSIHQDANGFKVYRLDYKKPKRWNRLFRHYQNLYDTIEEENPDIIFSHGVSFGDARIVRKYLIRHPHVILYADSHTDNVNSAKNWLSKHILHPIIWRRTAKILEPYMKKCWGVTPLRCQFLKDVYHINPSLVEFLPMGVDDELIPSDRDSVRSRICKELGLGEDDMLFFTGGKIDRLKNTHVIVEALQELNNPQLHLVICGVLTPEMDYLKESINASKNIHYLGWCDAERVMDCMVAADFACFPGTHSTLWEQAVGVGLPMICKHWDGMEHVNVNGNCLFIQGEDVKEMEKCIHILTKTESFCEIKALAKKASESFLYSNISRKAIGV